MCGIVGYIGGKNAKDFLLEGLKTLEYRGYDSAGVAVIGCDGRIKQIKKAGRVSAMQSLCGNLCGNTGIGHTRWATHGEPTDENAHPHLSGKFAVVHNGIIENHAEIRQELEEKGFVFSSQTDTEVIAHLLNWYYEGVFLDALVKTISRIKGSYAIAAICCDFEGKIAVARQNNPLVIGISKDEGFLSSDILALPNNIEEKYLLCDGDIAILEKGKVSFFDCNCNSIGKTAIQSTTVGEKVELGIYKHFMQKEIYHIPKSLRDTLSNNCNAEALEKLTRIAPKRIIIVACGTAYHSGVCGKYIIEKFVNIPVEVEIASEFRYRNPILSSDDLVVAISQSGETADTLAALNLAKEKGCKNLCISNVSTSSLVALADMTLLTSAGAEIGVAATKSYSTQLLMLYMLCSALVRQKNIHLSKEILQNIRILPTLAEELLEKFSIFSDLAEKYQNSSGVYFIGRNIDYATALEGALKLKEISYIHSEGYAAGELKHGTIAMISSEVLVVAIITQRHVAEKTISNIQEVKARKGNIIVITQFEDVAKRCMDIANDVILLPQLKEEFMPIISVIPLQIFAYEMSIKKGNDPDHPRNLAKSVTVE